MKKTIGLISATYTNRNFGYLTNNRTLASLPFGGRYRLIDFALSSLVNSGISTVGLITPYYFRSLIDHVGGGNPWGLGKKVGGLFLLPASVYGVRSEFTKLLLRDLISNAPFLERDNADYVLLCSGSNVFNTDFRPMLKQHERNAYPITLAYQKVGCAEQHTGMFLDISREGMVQSIRYQMDGEANLFADAIVIDRKFLLSLMDWFRNLDYMDMMDIVAENLSTIGVDTWEVPGILTHINSNADYMWASMELLDSRHRNALFPPDRQIFTKVQDDPPACYLPGASVKRSLVTAGSQIEGSVDQSVIFRGVHVEPEAHVEGCVLMHHSRIGKGAHLSHVICDKYVTISPGTRLSGTLEHPIVLEKNKVF